MVFLYYSTHGQCAGGIAPQSICEDHVKSKLQAALQKQNAPATRSEVVWRYMGRLYIALDFFLAGQTKPHWSILNFRFQRPSFLKVPPRAPQFQC